MAEGLNKANKFVEGSTLLGGAMKRSGLTPFSDMVENTADFAKSDRERIKREEARFQAEQKQEEAESFKPKSAKAVKSRRAATAAANRSESLLTRTI